MQLYAARRNRVIAEMSSGLRHPHLDDHGLRGKDFLRKVVLRMYWDGEDDPSVEVPIGDFFRYGPRHDEKFQLQALFTEPRKTARALTGLCPTPPPRKF